MPWRSEGVKGDGRLGTALSAFDPFNMTGATMSESSKIGRPSSYSDDLADIICERLADGQSLRTICADEAMPSQSMVFRWLADDRHVAFREQYAKAREAQADTLADEILDIADDARNDWMQREEGLAFNAEHVQRSRLRVEARKWLAGKMRPKKYGDSARLEHSGPDGGAIETRDVADPKKLARAVALLLAEGSKD